MSAAPRVALRILFALIAAAVLAYAIDALVLRISRRPDATVTVRSYYVVPTKDGHVDYLYNDAIDEPCVQALFPHRGESPCWYLRHHPEQRINVDTGGKPEYPH